MNPNAVFTSRILLIDDNPAVQEDFRDMLRLELAIAQPLHEEPSASLGRSPSRLDAQRFELEYALSGQEGLDKLRSRSVKGGRIAWLTSTRICPVAGMVLRPFITFGKRTALC
ncbi:MAG: hypothetical protein JO066_15470 [Verrucomicrobia bacterium]|nr:hypothetical protein [Verrucomicrobiota bacterium]